MPGRTQQHVGHARRVLALQVAAEQRDVLAGPQLAPDGSVQRRIELRQLERRIGLSTFAALLSSRCAIDGLISVSSTPRCNPSTCWSIDKSSVGAGRPSSCASSISNVDTVIRRRNAGEKLKLSADNTSVASMSSAARCFFASTGVKRLAPAADAIAQRRQAADVLRRVHGALPGLVRGRA